MIPITIIRRAAVLSAATLVAAAGVTTGSLLGGPAGPASSADNVCPDLVHSGTCTIDFASNPSGSAVFHVPETADSFTVVAGGGSGGNAGGQAQQGGAGALIIATIPMHGLTGDQRDIRVWLGASGENGGIGWSNGGRGGDGRGYNSGGNGGGSTALAFAVDPDDEFLVAGGGGGGGGNTEFDGSFGHGGYGGQAGTYLIDGQRGQFGPAGTVSNGGGGAGASAGGPAGEDGESGGHWYDPDNRNGGGGGGGGAAHGGGGGETGSQSACNLQGYCPPDDAPGAGGGGGAGDSWVDGTVVSQSWIMTGTVGDGSVIVYTGEPDIHECTPGSWDPRYHTVPDDVGSYAFVAVGGQGERGHNGEHTQGTGALVTGLLDVTGIHTLEYWVGCAGDGDHGGAGWAVPGKGGHASSDLALNGGQGGGATAITNADVEWVDMLVAAGGGGGSGGGTLCIDHSCKWGGGRGGSGGGVEGGRLPFNGTRGDAFYGHGGGGGAGGKMPHSDGGDGEGSPADGGGGGGGAGFPHGGDGGNASGDGGGGGGGAGSSYVSGSRVINPYIQASGWEDDGLLLLIPIPLITTSLTIEKSVTGSGAEFGHGPFTVHVQCERHGDTVLDDTIQLDAGASHTFHDLISGTTCTATETGTGGATKPAGPATVTLDAEPATITLANEFDRATLEVTLRSEVAGSTRFDLPDLIVQVTCVFDGDQVSLPDHGRLTFDGAQSWDGQSHSLEVPVGADCTAEQAPTTGDPQITYDPAATVTVADGGAAIDIVDAYPLADLAVTKQVAGNGAHPDGAEYPMSIACTFAGAPVTGIETSLQLQVGQTGSFAGLPHDAVCEVEETDRVGAVAVQYAPSSTVHIAGDDAVTVTNTYEDGGLHITVQTAGDGAGWANTGTVVDLRCSLEGIPVLEEFVPVAPGGGLISRSVDEGADCQIEEVETGGATAVTYPLGQTVTISADGVASLEVRNVFDTAPLVVESGNDGPGSRFANRPTTVTVSGCTFNGLDASFERQVGFDIHGGSSTIDGIVVGAECDVAQTQGGGATQLTVTATDGEPSEGLEDGIRVTVGASGPTTVTFLNTFDLASVRTQVTVAGAGAYAANTDYLVEVQCRFNGIALHAIGPDGIATLRFSPDGELQPGYGASALAALPAGAECTAVETQIGGATIVAYDPQDGDRSGIVVAPGTIEITNTFEATTVTVSKTVAGNDAAAHADDTFWFEQVCTFNGHLLPPPPGVSQPATFPLTDGQSRALEQIPVGAECAVVELSDHDAIRVEPSGEQTVTVGVDPAAVGFTNVFDVEPLLVRQVVAGDGSATYAPDEFWPQVTCTYPDGDRVFLPDDGFVPLTAPDHLAQTIAVPVGATCAIGERVAVRSTSRSFSPPVVVEAGSQPLLEATARYDLGTIQVRAEAYGDFAADARFGYETTCVWPDPADPQPIPPNEPGQAAFTIGSGQTMTVQSLLGAICTVTETDTADALRVVVSASGPVVATGADDATARVSADASAFRFDNYLTGSLPVTGAEAAAITAGIGSALLLAGLVLLLLRSLRRRNA